MLDFTNFGKDWQAALDEAAAWNHECSVRRTAGGSFVVVYNDDPYNIEVQ